MTYELPRETEKRRRGQLKKASRTLAQGKEKGKQKEEPMVSTMKRKEVTFNIATYKYHSLGDYAANIRMFGTCDSYSTEPVSTEGHTNEQPQLEG